MFSTEWTDNHDLPPFKILTKIWPNIDLGAKNEKIWQYLDLGAQIEDTESTSFSIKVCENKVPLFFSYLAPRPRYGHILVLKGELKNLDFLPNDGAFWTKNI